MTRSIANALKSVAVLTVIAVVCVALLAVCNVFFPKYVPTLDRSTAALVNSVCPTGVDDAQAFDGGYIVMLDGKDCGADFDEFNKSHKSDKAEILAVYGEPKGVNAGAYIIESQAAGRDGEIVILVAYRSGAIVGATVKKQNESYWSKLPDNLFDSITGETGDVDLNAVFGKTGATVSLSAVNRAINLSCAFSRKHGADIIDALEKTALGVETEAK